MGPEGAVAGQCAMSVNGGRKVNRLAGWVFDLQIGVAPETRTMSNFGRDAAIELHFAKELGVVRGVHRHGQMDRDTAQS